MQKGDAMKATNLLIVDDNKLNVRLLETFLKSVDWINPLGIAMDADELTAILEKKTPQVIIFNQHILLNMGNEAIQGLTRKIPTIKFILLTSSLDAFVIKRCLQMGVTGFVTTKADETDLLNAIKIVLEGDTYMDMQSLNALTKDLASEAVRETGKREGIIVGNAKITKREKQILNYIAKQFTTASIAQKLDISQRTVDAHRRNIMLKLGVRNTAGLIKIAYEKNIIDLMDS
jgi:DNA-binding NarL/FixJ family response regulator